MSLKYVVLHSFFYFKKLWEGTWVKLWLIHGSLILMFGRNNVWYLVETNAIL